MPVDYERARLIPGAVFASPWEVLACPELTREQKIDVLLRWAYDSAEPTAAHEQGTAGGEQDLHDQILRVLQALQERVDGEQPGPSAHHGLPH